MANISIGGQISLLQRKASLDLRYGPYSSISDAYDVMGPSGDEVITAGLPFGITEDDGSVSVYVWTKGEDATENDYKKLDKEHVILFNGFIDISVSVKQQSFNNVATKDNIVFLNDGKQFAYRDGLKFYINWKNRYVWSNESLIPYDDVIYININDNKAYYYNGTTLTLLASETFVSSINNQAPDENGNVNLTKEHIGLEKVDNTSDTEKVVKGANEDGSGNNIATTYETKSDATTKNTALQNAISALQTSVGNLTGLDSTNFGGFSIESTDADAISNISTIYTADGYTNELLWYMAGTSLSSVKAYRYNGSGTPTLISNDSYDCVDFSGLIANVATLSSNLTALGLEYGELDEKLYNEGDKTITHEYNFVAGHTMGFGDGVFACSIKKGSTIHYKFIGDATKIANITYLCACDSTGGNRTTLSDGYNPVLNTQYDVTLPVDVEYLTIYLHSSLIPSDAAVTLQIVVEAEQGDIPKLDGRLDAVEGAVGEIADEVKGFADDVQELSKNFEDKLVKTEFPVPSNRTKTNATTNFGWGLAICENKTIGAISVVIPARDTPPTKIRIQLLKDNISGASLADKTVDVSISANEEKTIYVEFDSPVYYEGIIYCIVRYNQTCNWYKWDDTTDYPYSDIRPCCIYTSWDSNPIYVNVGFNICIDYFYVGKGLSQQVEEEIVNKVKEEIDVTELEQEVAAVTQASDIGLEISLPAKIYAVVGDTLQLFYKGIIGAVNPYNYDILVSCSKGKPYPRYWEFTPSAGDVGTYTLDIKVKSNKGQILSQASTSLVVVSAPSSPSSQKNVVCFGDSNTVDGSWCAEAYRRLTGSNGSPAGKGLSNISFCGMMVNKGAGYCGFGGWTWGSYATSHATAIRFYVSGVSAEPSYGAIYTNNGKNFTVQEVNITDGTGSLLCTLANSSDRPTASGTLTKTSGNGDATISFSSYTEDVANPLWDAANNKFSFIPYANEYCNGDIDVVYTLLTWNGIFAWQTNWSGMEGTMSTFATTLHTEFPNAKLRILGMQVPPVLGSMGYADSYGMVQTILAMNKFYQEFADEHSDFVEFINVSSQFDTDNNCRTNVKKLKNARMYKSFDAAVKYYMGDTVDKTVNTDGVWVHTPWVCIVAEFIGEWDASKWQVSPESVYEDYCVNAVHPGYNGYCQIADVVYRDFVANFCQ